MEYKFNKNQTVVDEELLKSLPKNVRSQLIDYVENVPFINWLVQPEDIRGYAKNKLRYKFPNEEDPNDLELDPNGRIRVDLIKPHILEDMDFFRERALYFIEHRRYTDITPNPNPKSAYAEFWREELRRWKDGIVRPSDGEWIPGGLYFYWNYSPIWIVEDENESSGKAGKRNKGRRKREFPKPYLGDYLFYHYMQQAMDIGRHGKGLKCRGIGASFKFGSLSPRNMYVYPGSGNPNFHLASDKTYLKGDKGIWGKIIDCLDWIAENTPMPRLRLIDKKEGMEIQLGYLDRFGSRQGLLSSAYGISVKDDPDKARGIRGPLIHYEEDGAYPNLEDNWNINRAATEEGDTSFGFQMGFGCVCAGTKIWTKNNKHINIEDLKQEDGILGFDIDGEKAEFQTISWIQPPTDKECVEIKTKFRILKCSTDHPILVRNKRTYRDPNNIDGYRRDYNAKLDKWYVNPRHKQVSEYSKVWKQAKDIKEGDVILCIEKVDLWGKDELFDPRLIGMLIGDGSYGLSIRATRGNIIEYKAPRFFNCDDELNNYVYDNYDAKFERGHTTSDGREYKETRLRGLIPKLKEVGIAGQSKDNKRLPPNYMDLTKEHAALLLAGLYDTDGYICYLKSSTKKIQISQSSEELLKQIQELLQKFGIYGIISKKEPRISPDRKDKNVYYTLSISDTQSMLNFCNEIPLLIEYKIEALSKIKKFILNRNKVRVYNTFNNIREEKVFEIASIGMQPIYNLTAKENNTYIANGIITHNTGGTVGADFEGSEKLFYHPEAYNIYGIPNVFDLNSNGESNCGFFWGSYLNRRKCYNEHTGEPDVVKALISVLLDWEHVRANSTDARAITQKRAENCITPQDAVMRVEGTIFPISDLKDYLAQIMPNIVKFTSGHYYGDLHVNLDGNIEWKISEAARYKVISDYPVKDNKNKEGAIEIFQMPIKINDKFDRFRYISGIDPIDDDHSTTNSLGSIFIMDRYTDTIVAEYTGRPGTANQFYEICYRLLRFYGATANYENDKKGLYAYFSTKNALHLLCDNPEILSEKSLVSVRENYGNKKKGTNSSKNINQWGRRLQADWLVKAAYGEVDSETGEHNGLMNMHKVRSVGYLKELIAWHPDQNADRVSAMGMLMILYEDVAKIEHRTIQREVRGRLHEDSFFQRHSHSRMN